MKSSVILTENNSIAYDCLIFIALSYFISSKFVSSEDSIIQLLQICVR